MYIEYMHKTAYIRDLVCTQDVHTCIVHVHACINVYSCIYMYMYMYIHVYCTGFFGGCRKKNHFVKLAPTKSRLPVHRMGYY